MFTKGLSGGDKGQILGLWYEQLGMPDLSIDPSIFDFRVDYVPLKYYAGRLADSWEISSDWMSYTFHIRQGACWQDIPPMNGRQVTADDIAWSYNRELGLAGFPKAPFASTSSFAYIVSATATDKYTVVFKSSQPSSEMLHALLDTNGPNQIMPREAVEKWGDVNDWRHQIGTGPFILTDYVSGSSITATRNPNYYLADPKYPQNKLPYPDQIKIVVITDSSTALSALRTGKIDLIQDAGWEQVASLNKTNPELLHISRPALGDCITMMVDKKPFSDIKVRRAMQMAIDLQTIAQTHYGGFVDGTPTGLEGIKGFYVPFSDWPQDVKDGYTYNPEGAKKLLAEAGYPTGFKTSVVVPSNQDIELFQILKSYLSAIGVDMEIKLMDPAAALAYITAGLHEMTWQNGWRTAPPVIALNPYYTKHYSNAYSHVNDPVFNGLVEQAKITIDENKLSEVVKQADMYGIQQQWRLMVLPKVAMDFYQPWLHGYQAQLRMLSTTTAYLWIDQNLKKSLGH